MLVWKAFLGCCTESCIGHVTGWQSANYVCFPEWQNTTLFQAVCSPSCCCTQILRGEEVVCHWLAWQGAVRHWPFLWCFAHIFTMELESCTAAYVTERWRYPKWLKHSGISWWLAEYCFFFPEMLVPSVSVYSGVLCLSPPPEALSWEQWLC